MFIEPQHPKTMIKPESDVIGRILAKGWIGQPKINGARAQIHIHQDGTVICYTRQGRKHTKKMPEFLAEHLYEIFKPKSGWNVVDAEWERFKDKVHVFDILKVNDSELRRLTYNQRYSQILKKVYFQNNMESLNVFLLPVFKTVRQCVRYLKQNDETIEGLVFKALNTKGWPNTAIIRCRK